MGSALNPHDPETGAVDIAAVTKRDVVPRSLVNSIIEALGFNPDDVVAVWVDRFTVTAVHRKTGKRQRRYIYKDTDT